MQRSPAMRSQHKLQPRCLPCRFNTTSIVTTFQGYLQLPSPATLTLFLQSSDGSEMYLDWRNTCEPLERQPGSEFP